MVRGCSRDSIVTSGSSLVANACCGLRLRTLWIFTTCDPTSTFSKGNEPRRKKKANCKIPPSNLIHARLRFPELRQECVLLSRFIGTSARRGDDSVLLSFEFSCSMNSQSSILDMSGCSFLETATYLKWRDVVTTSLLFKLNKEWGKAGSWELQGRHAWWRWSYTLSYTIPIFLEESLVSGPQRNVLKSLSERQRTRIFARVSENNLHWIDWVFCAACS